MVQSDRSEPIHQPELVRTAHSGRWRGVRYVILNKHERMRRRMKVTCSMMMKLSGLCIALLLWLSPAKSQGLFESAQAEEQSISGQPALSIGGFIRSVGYIGQTPAEETPYLQSAYGQVGLLLNARAATWATAKADIRFRYGTEWQQPVSEFDIREAYVDLYAGPTGFKFGKFISPWGKGTVFNPTEKVTPMDPTVRSPIEDDMNLGVWGLQGHVNLGTYVKLTGTWQPLYQPSVLLIDPVPMPDYVMFLEPEYPGVELKESSYGFNLDLYAPAMDAALYWFEGYHHWPGIKYDSFVIDSVTMQPLALNMLEKAYRIRMLGMDMSKPVGAWIFRIEGAWQQTVESHTDHEYLPFPELSYTAEIEKSGNWLTLLAGYYGKYILEFTAPAADPSLSAGQDQFLQLMQSGFPLTGSAIDGLMREQVNAFNRLYNYQLEELYHTAFVVLKGSFWHDQVEVTAPFIYNITTEEWVIQPKISYMPGDGIKLTAGYSGLYGQEESLYDMVGPTLNAGFLSIKLTF